MLTEAGLSSNLAHSFPSLWHLIGITGISCCENVKPLAAKGTLQEVPQTFWDGCAKGSKAKD